MQKAVIAGGNYRLYIQLMGAGAGWGVHSLEKCFAHSGRILDLKAAGLVARKSWSVPGGASGSCGVQTLNAGVGYSSNIWNQNVSEINVNCKSPAWQCQCVSAEIT